MEKGEGRMGVEQVENAKIKKEKARLGRPEVVGTDGLIGRLVFHINDPL